MLEEKKHNYFINSAFFSGLQRLSIMAFGIGSFVVLSRALSKEHRGVWDLFLVVTANIELFRQCLVRNAYIKYLNSSPPDETPKISSAALAMNIIVTLLIGLTMAIFNTKFARFLNAPDLAPVLYIFLIGLLILIPFSHFEWTQNAYSDFRGIFWAYLVRQCTWFSLMLLHMLIFNTIELYQLAIYYVIGIVAGTFMSYRYVRKYINRKWELSTEWLKTLWKFGRIILGSGFSTMVFKNSDQMFIPRVLGTATLAVYNTALRVVNLLDLPSHVISEVMFPRSAQTSAFGNVSQLKYLYEKSVGAVLSVLIPACIFIFIFPDLIITILAGSQYLDSVLILRVLLINSIFTAFLKQFATIMDSSGRAKANFRLITTMAITCLILCYIFIHKLHSPLGAAYAIIITHIMGFIISQYLLNKHYKINFLNTFKYAVLFYPEMTRKIKEIFFKKWGASL